MLCILIPCSLHSYSSETSAYFCGRLIVTVLREIRMVRIRDSYLILAGVGRKAQSASVSKE